jgi:propionate CoA-transferase
VLYVTERCVFSLGEGLRLVEGAAGIDVERDILGQMASGPSSRPRRVRTMDPRIFRRGRCSSSLRCSTCSWRPPELRRRAQDAVRQLRGLSIRSADDIESVRRVFEALCRRIGHKVALVVNYDGFRLDETLSDAYFEMVSELQAKYYSTAVRYTTSAFMRLKLGAELSARRSAAHVFENARRGRGVRCAARRAA